MMTNPHLESNVQWQIKPFTQEKDYIYIFYRLYSKQKCDQNELNYWLSKVQNTQKNNSYLRQILIIEK